jgi:hypothetical protein
LWLRRHWLSPEGPIAQTIEAIDDAALPRFAVASVKPRDPNGAAKRTALS